MALGVALGGILLAAAGSPALAERDYGPACHDRLNADKARIDRDAHRYGEGSPHVQKDVDKMEADRSWCRDHHADWDHSMFDIGIYIHK
jgi:hypothetical protein